MQNDFNIPNQYNKEDIINSIKQLEVMKLTLAWQLKELDKLEIMYNNSSDLSYEEQENLFLQIDEMMGRTESSIRENKILLKKIKEI